MYISHTKFRLAELNWDNLKESSDLLAEMLLTQNPIWAAINPSPDRVYKFMHDKIAEILDCQQELRDKGIIKQDQFINFVYLDKKDNIVGAWTNYELMQYLSKKSQVYLPEFEVLETFGKSLQQSIDLNDKVQGRSIYGMFGGVKTEFIGSKLIINFTVDINRYLFGLGFKVMYGRSSNDKSLTLVERYGGEITSQQTGNYKDKQLTLSFIKWDLEKLSLAILRELQRKQKGRL